MEKVEKLPANFAWQSLPALIEILVKLVEALITANSKSTLRVDPVVSAQLVELKQAMAEFTKKGD